MAANWTTIRANLESWVTGVTGLAATQVHWRDTKEASGWKPSGIRILLDITSVQTIGTDEIRYTDAAVPAAGAELDVTVSGPRTMVLEVRIDVLDQRAGYDAITYAENLRNSLRAPSTYALFSAADLGFARVLAETDLDRPFQGRRLSSLQMDILLNSYGTYSDTADTYIGSMEYETDFRGADGNPVAHQLSGTAPLE